MGRAAELREQLDEIERGVAVVAAAAPVALRLVGPDRVEALHRVITQEVKALRPGQGRLSLLLAPKGQFRALLAVFAGDEALWLLAPSGRGEALRAGLGRYLVFSKTTLEPPAPGSAAVLLLGPRAVEVATAAGAPADVLVAGGHARSGEDGRAVHWFGHTLLGLPGLVAVADSDGATADLDRLARSLGAVPAGAEAVELARIRVGFPAWGRELTESVLPAEVGVEPLTVSYTKGCYVGQETVARMKTYGRPTRNLVGVRLTSGDGQLPELPLPLAAAGEEKARGTVTSLGAHPDLGGVGLALVRRELASAGTHLAGAGRSFEVATLPLW